MGVVLVDLSMSLDGFIAGPNDDVEHGLGLRGAERLHDWLFSGDTPDPRSIRFGPSWS